MKSSLTVTQVYLTAFGASYDQVNNNSRLKRCKHRNMLILLHMADNQTAFYIARSAIQYRTNASSYFHDRKGIKQTKKAGQDAPKGVITLVKLNLRKRD